MTDLVVFTRLNATHLKGQKLWPHYDRKAPIVLNPEMLPAVEPLFWKLHNGQVVEMSPYEKRTRLYEIKYGIQDTDPIKVLYPRRARPILFGIALILFILTFMHGGLHG